MESVQGKCSDWFKGTYIVLRGFDFGSTKFEVWGWWGSGNRVGGLLCTRFFRILSGRSGYDENYNHICNRADGSRLGWGLVLQRLLVCIERCFAAEVEGPDFFSEDSDGDHNSERDESTDEDAWDKS